MGGADEVPAATVGRDEFQGRWSRVMWRLAAVAAAAWIVVAMVTREIQPAGLMSFTALSLGAWSLHRTRTVIDERSITVFQGLIQTRSVPLSDVDLVDRRGELTAVYVRLRSGEELALRGTRGSDLDEVRRLVRSADPAAPGRAPVRVYRRFRDRPEPLPPLLSEVALRLVITDLAVGGAWLWWPTAVDHVAAIGILLVFHVLIFRYLGLTRTEIHADRVVLVRGRHHRRDIARDEIAGVGRRSPVAPVHLQLHCGREVELPGSKPQDLDGIRRLLASP